MTVLITMAGLGTRFSRAGYTLPKYKIFARGRTLFDWSMLSLSHFFDDQFVFATLTNSDQDWLLERAGALGIRNVAFSSREQLSRGQAETAYDALPLVPSNEPLWIYNIDTYVADGMHPSDSNACDGCIHVFHNIDPGMSFVRYNQAGEVAEIAEKRVISDWATVGMYGFASAKLFGEIYLDAYERAALSEVGGERYIAPLYQLMLARGARLVAPKLKNADVQILGTPEQVLVFDEAALPPIGNSI